MCTTGIDRWEQGSMALPVHSIMHSPLEKHSPLECTPLKTALLWSDPVGARRRRVKALRRRAPPPCSSVTLPRKTRPPADFPNFDWRAAASGSPSAAALLGSSEFALCNLASSWTCLCEEANLADLCLCSLHSMSLRHSAKYWLGRYTHGGQACQMMTGNT